MIAGENNYVTCFGLILKHFTSELGGAFYSGAPSNKISINNSEFTNFTCE